VSRDSQAAAAHKDRTETTVHRVTMERLVMMVYVELMATMEPEVSLDNLVVQEHLAAWDNLVHQETKVQQGPTVMRVKLVVVVLLADVESAD